MESNRTLVMIFADDNGTERSITINKPAEYLDAATVSAQMDALIASQIIFFGEFETVATTKVSAKFVTQTKTAVAVA